MRRRQPFGIPILLVVLALIAAACGSEDESATTTAPVTTATPATTTAPATTTTTTVLATTTTTTATTTTTTVPLFEPLSGVFTAAIVEPLITTNPWVEWGGADAFALAHSTETYLYSISVPDFLQVPVLAAEAPPDLVREGDRWTATIALRTGFLWSDGVEVTADDLVFTFELGLELGWDWVNPIRQPDDPATEENEQVRWVETVEAPDTHTAKISFAPSEEPPGRSAYQNGILFHPILPAHFWGPIDEACEREPDPAACRFAADGVGQPSAGPLVLHEWAPGGATLVANPNYYYRGVTYTVYDNLVYTQTGGAHDLDEIYFGEPAGNIVSQWTDGPFVEEVRLIEYGPGDRFTSHDAAFEAFIRGDVDYVLSTMAPGTVSAQVREGVLALPDVETSITPSGLFHYFAFNVRRAPMNDVAFRQAFAYLFDKEFLTDSVGQTAIPIYSLVPKYYTAWHTDDVNRWGFGMSAGARLEAAVQVLADAGYTWATRPEVVRDEDGNETGEFVNGEGLTQPDGTPVPVIAAQIPGGSPDPLREAVGIWLVRWGERLGITIEWSTPPPPELLARVFPPEADGTGWDIYGWGWGVGDPTAPCTSHQAFFGADQDAALLGGFNTPGYNNPEFEVLSDQLDAAATIEEAREICQAMERHIAENLPYLVLWAIPGLHAWRDHIEFPITDLLDGINTHPAGWLGQVKVGAS